MTDEKKTPTEGDSKGIDLRYVRLTAGGDPLPIDPDTGNIDVDKLTDAQRAELEAAARRISAAVKKALPNTDAIIEAGRKMTEAIKRATGIMNAEQWREIAQNLRENILPLQELYDEIDALEPYLKDELKKDEYGGMTFDDLLHKYTAGEMLELRHDPNSDIYKLFEAAQEARAAALPIIGTSPTDKLNTPVDRVNFLAWNDFKETGGQIRFNMMSAADKRNPERQQLNISMLYALSFADDPDIKTTKELNHYDRRLMQGIDTIYTTDTDDRHIYLYSDIFHAMGGKGNPSENQRKKIDSSLTKQGTARVYMNNKKEAAEYNYPEIHYDGNILEFERIRVIYNGQEVTAVKVNRRPAMMDFAAQRKQITDVPLKVLQSGISQTDGHLRIEDYLLYRISRAKNDLASLQEKQQKKYTKERQQEINAARKLTILMQTFHEYAGTAGKKKDLRGRAEETAGRYLKHYKSCGYITDYKIISSDRIEITLPIK